MFVDPAGPPQRVLLPSWPISHPRGLSGLHAATLSRLRHVGDTTAGHITKRRRCAGATCSCQAPVPNWYNTDTGVGTLKASVRRTATMQPARAEHSACHGMQSKRVLVSAEDRPEGTASHACAQKHACHLMQWGHACRAAAGTRSTVSQNLRVVATLHDHNS